MVEVGTYLCRDELDDHRGLIPSRMTLSHAGLRGVLVRSKTSGVGKKREELHVFVSRRAFLSVEDWLDKGLTLWNMFNAPRDCFLGLPTESLDGMRYVEARYSDGAAMSRALLNRITGNDGKLLLHLPKAACYWTEHPGIFDFMP